MKKIILAIITTITLFGCFEKNSPPQLVTMYINGLAKNEAESLTQSSIRLVTKDENGDGITTKITADGAIVEKRDENNYLFTPMATSGIVNISIELKDSKGDTNIISRGIDIFKAGSVTFMVYMAGDNNLNTVEPQGDMAGLDLKEIKAANINPRKTNVVILGDFIEAYQNKISSGIYTKSYNSLVEEIRYTAPIDTGKKETLKALLSYAKTNYPAERYILSLWGHGNGWLDDNIKGKNPSIRRAIGYDAGIGNSWLDLWEVEDALKETGMVLDILYTDACLMGGVEFYYQMKDVAKYICASPELTPGPGGDYTRILESVDANYRKPTVDVAKAMQMINLEGYRIGGSQYNYIGWGAGERDNVVYSVVDTFRLTNLKQKIDDFANVLKRTENLSIITAIRDDVLTYNSNQDFPNEPDSFVDLGALAEKVETYTGSSQELKDKAQAVVLAVKEVVPYCYWQNGYLIKNNVLETIKEEGTSGISIYLDMYKSTGSSSYGYSTASKFAIESTAWLGLINTY